MGEVICKCGSYAINPHRHGREPGVDLHLCDVCYWRSRAERMQGRVEELEALLRRYADDKNWIKRDISWFNGPSSGMLPINECRLGPGPAREVLK